MRPPEVAEDGLTACGQDDQGGILPEGSPVVRAREEGVKGILGQPRDRQTEEVGDQQRDDSDEQQSLMPPEVGSNPGKLLENGRPPCPSTR
jgi:hypothetical protein